MFTISSRIKKIKNNVYIHLKVIMCDTICYIFENHIVKYIACKFIFHLFILYILYLHSLFIFPWTFYFVYEYNTAMFFIVLICKKQTCFVSPVEKYFWKIHV